MIKQLKSKISHCIFSIHHSPYSFLFAFVFIPTFIISFTSQSIQRKISPSKNKSPLLDKIIFQKTAYRPNNSQHNWFSKAGKYFINLQSDTIHVPLSLLACVSIYSSLLSPFLSFQLPVSSYLMNFSTCSFQPLPLSLTFYCFRLFSFLFSLFLCVYFCSFHVLSLYITSYQFASPFQSLSRNCFSSFGLNITLCLYFSFALSLFTFLCCFCVFLSFSHVIAFRFFLFFYLSPSL